MDVIDLTNQAMSYYSDMSYPSGIVIDAGSGDDTVWTSGGADTVFAGPGNDVIWTGGGDDAAFGGLDDDLYVIGIGDGMDTIEEEGGFDTISLIGLTIGDLTILAIGLDLEIGTGSGKVTVLGQFLDIAHRVEQLLFEDGSTYDLTMIAPATVPVPGAVWLFASALAGLGATAWRKRRFV
jgi:Ca2+-binding RTX toxin-like protein